MTTSGNKQATASQTFHELQVWKVSVDLAVIIYKMTATFNEQYQHGISDDLKKGVMDICSGIALGYQKTSAADRANEYSAVIALTYRLESLLYVAARLGLLSSNVLAHYTGVLTEIRNMIGKLIRTAQRSKKIQ